MNINFFKTTVFQIKKRFPFLHYVSIFHVIGSLILLVLIQFDDRQLTGVNVWIKPLKFLTSTFILLWTIGWYLMKYPFWEKSKSVIAFSLTILLSLENILITYQASRGVKSHYNVETFWDAAIFQTMGIAIGFITLFMFWFLIKSFSPKLNASTTMKWGFRIAWIALLFGTAIGGSAMIGQNAHAVGVADGGEGIPALNWSTEGGDYRIAHFLGLHAIQIIPLTIYFFQEKITSKNLSKLLSYGFSLLYLAWIVFTFYQAKSGKPLF